MLAWQTDVSHPKLGLRCIGFMHDVNASVVVQRSGCKPWLLSRTRWPFPESVRHHNARAFGCHIARNNYRRSSRSIVQSVELLHVLPREHADALGVSFARLRVPRFGGEKKFEDF